MKKNKLFRVTTYPISFSCLLNGQARFFSDHFDITLISNKDPKLAAIADKEGVSCCEIPMTRAITPFSDLLSLLKMIRFFLKNKPDIVHSHTPKAGLIAMLAAFITQRPSRIHTVAGLPLMASEGFKRHLLVFIEKLTYFCATAVIPNSRGLYDYILEKKLCPPNKIRFISPGSSNGIDLSYFSRKAITVSPEETRKKLGFDSSHFVFIFVGRIVKDKGINELVAAFCKFSKTNPTVRLLVVGDFDHGLQPINTATKTILENKPEIILTGFQKDVRPFIAASDILLLPSYREGLPQILLQACALDTPCIASHIIGCSDIINSKNGMLVDPRSSDSLFQAMSKVIDKNNVFQNWRLTARESIERYSQKNIWNSLLELYKKTDPIKTSTPSARQI